MSAKRIDGVLISTAIKDEIKSEVALLKQKGIEPSLAVVLVGEDPASKTYVGNKEKACEYTGIKSQTYRLPAETTEKELLELVETLNESKAANGILIQLPLPKHINEENVLNAVHPDKDVDCFHPMNVGRLWIGRPYFQPCTPIGIIELIERSGYSISGKNCVVIGRSNIVGKPVAALLMQRNGTVTICHTKTKNVKEICLGADIIVVASGKMNTLTADMVKPGAIIIDVGINRNAEGKLCGDVDFLGCAEVAEAITPVPGGVGPMTIAMLMQNCISAAINQNKDKNEDK